MSFLFKWHWASACGVETRLDQSKSAGMSVRHGRHEYAPPISLRSPCSRCCCAPASRQGIAPQC